MARTPGPTTSGTITANGQAVSADLLGNPSALITVTGTYTGLTVTFEGSEDGGTTWHVLYAVQVSNNLANAANTPLSSLNLAAANGAFVLAAPGFTTCRVRATAYSSGTAVVRILPNEQSYIPALANIAPGTLSSNSLANEGQAASGFGTALVIQAQQYALASGGNVMRLRVPDVSKDFASSAITAGTPQTVWTPAAGKKFRLMGWRLSDSAAGSIIFKYGAGATTLFRTEAVAAGGVSNCGDFGPALGWMPGAANDVLKLDVTANGTVAGVVWGVEE